MIFTLKVLLYLLYNNRLFHFSGDLSNENAVLEWLIQHRSTGEEGEVIEEATAKTLDAMVGTVDKVVVLFCKI